MISRTNSVATSVRIRLLAPLTVELILQPADAGLKSKDMPIDTFFHKIVMTRIVCAFWRPKSTPTQN